MFEQHLRQLRTFGLKIGEYAVFGSGPLAVRGIRDAADIDMLVKPEILSRFRSDPQWIEGIGRDGTPCLRQNGFELFTTWFPGLWDVDALIRSADVIENVPYVCLDAVLEWKQRLGRDKDQADIKLIQTYIAKHNKMY